MEKTNSLLDRKDIVKEMTHGNLRKIYIMQAKATEISLEFTKNKITSQWSLNQEGG